MSSCTPRVVLASSSPWRRRFFRLYTPHWFISDEKNFYVPNIDEKSIRDVDPRKMVLSIAKAKCEKAIDELAQEDDIGVIIACDQVSICQGVVLEKPTSKEEARKFFNIYSKGCDLVCMNGIVIQHKESGKRLEAVDETIVSIRPFSEEEVEDFLRHEDIYNAAGGLDSTILGKHVVQIKGNFPSSEGWPIYKIQEMMKPLFPRISCDIFQIANIKCILFDMDGLLLDTETLYGIAQQKILDRFGITFTYDVKTMMMGRKALDAAKIMIEHYQLEESLTPEEFIRERTEILDTMFPHSELMPGIERLLLHLHKHNIPMGIATSSNKRHFQMKTQNHMGLFNKVFQVMVTGDDITHSKPHPEIFEVAFKKLDILGNIDCKDVLVFEDAPLGVKAGKSAGMKTVMVTPESIIDSDVKPDQHIPNMFYFLPEQWGLPKYEE